MKNLLLKEFKLCFSVVNYIFLLFALMLLIPNYPCYVSFLYLVLNCFLLFKNTDLNKDLQYSLILPIKKSDIVKARCFSIGLYEIIFILLSIPFAILNIKLFPWGNNAGIIPNFAFYGFVLIMISVCHYIFFTIYYKKAEKHDKAFFITLLFYIILFFIFELPVWIIYYGNLQELNFLVKSDFISLLKQLPILIFGIIFYILGWILTYKVSAKRFDKVNL